jgi:uncharacterized protein
MLYVIVASDVPNSNQFRDKGRSEHIKRLEVLREQGRLIIAGPNPIENDNKNSSFSGSVVIAEFDSLPQAIKWAEDDPYFKCGAYQSVEVKPFKKVLP